ncbi:MAG TPA: ABC transporter ATP-binding protein [Bryobacteraceae bacterium]|jgi:ABC-2 type transport system ATP-binding protein|nr:ABC transporter ATP-binding protein [Bryobacteraceae bacterium]
MDAIIRMQDLTKRFAALTAVDHLNLEIGRGEIFGLVGPDGAGKTTTLRMLCGLMDPSEGEAWVAGENVAKNPRAVKDRIGYMAQRFGLYTDLTVDENMEFYGDLFGIPRAERQRLLPELLRMTRMEPFRKRQAGKLSGGMKQKLGLMCTLLHRPEILFLDEPTNGVDPVSRRDFWAILYQLVKDGITILVTTAYLDEAERCNRVGLMYKGRLIRCESPDHMRTHLDEVCYAIEAPNLRLARTKLQTCDGVLSVESSGDSLHVLLSPAKTSPQVLEQAIGPSTFRQITPSLEDVFIAMIRKEERQDAA